MGTVTAERTSSVSQHSAAEVALMVVHGVRKEAALSKGITSQQILLLLALYTADSGIYQHDLAGATDTGTSAVNRNLDLFKSSYRVVDADGDTKLVAGKGWVEVEQDPMNRRYNIARLTPLGRSVIDRITQKAARSVFLK